MLTPLLIAAMAAVTGVTFVDKDCKTLHGDPAGSVVKAETVALPGGDKPFKCTRAEGRVFHCVSSRNGNKLDLELTSETGDKLVLEQRGATGDSGPLVMAVVSRQDKRFQVSVVSRAKGALAVEYCAGTAQID